VVWFIDPPMVISPEITTLPVTERVSLEKVRFAEVAKVPVPFP